MKRLKIYDLRTQSLINPIGIDERPIFSYKLKSTEKNVLQTSYHIEVSQNADFTDCVWDSEVNSGESIAITYDGAALDAMTRYFWRVSVATDNAGETVSETAFFETGLMGCNETVWSSAKWISNTGKTINTDGLYNYAIEFDFSFEGEKAGVVFAARDKENYTRLEIASNRIEVYNYSDNAWDDGVKTRECIASIYARIEKENHIRIVMHNGVGIIILNGNTLIDSEMLIRKEKDHHPRKRTLMNFGFKACGRLEVTNLIISDPDSKTVYLKDDFNEKSYLTTLGKISDNTLIVENDFRITTASPILYFRKKFQSDGKVRKARLYSSARGFYDLYINGKKVNNEFYNPGFTDYRKRIYYQTYDVTQCLKDGLNTLGATVSKGYYTGYLGYNANPMIYGKKNSFISKLVITYENGETEIITTDETWEYTNKGHVINSDYLQGEFWDMRNALDWNDLFDGRWSKCAVESWSDTVVPTNGNRDDLKFELVSQVGTMAEIEREIIAMYIGENPKGHQIYDLGQNIVGSVKIKIKGKTGQSIKVRYGEMCYRDGRIYLANLRNAANTDMFILAGNKEEEFFPTFTSHGYRYIEITGCEHSQIIDVVGVSITNTKEITGDFECSNPLINKLQSNIQWGQRDNSLLVFTDCPQRNERMGWTGDAQVFAATAAYNMNIKAFMNKWIIDMRDAQLMYNRNGAMPDTAPLGGDNRPMGGCVGWGDAAVIVPWEMYKAYGDINILKDNYPMMREWVEYQSLPERQNCGVRYVDGAKAPSDLASKPYIQVQQSRGDHLTFDESTPFILSATAYAAYVAKLLSQTARILGFDNDAKKYYERFESIKEAFNEAWVKDDGSIAYWGEQSKSGINKTYYSEQSENHPSQTSYALAIDFDLIPEDKLLRTKEYFERSIRERDNCLSVGFLGISHLASALEKIGCTDIAFTLLEQEKHPSWLYSVKNGATTIWERWNSYIAEKDTFGDIAMNSFNHYSYGAVGEWMFGTVAGICCDEAGYKKIILKPTVGGELSYARAWHNSPYGMICSGWKRDNDKIIYNFSVPTNTTATIIIDGMKEVTVGSGEYEFIV